MEKLNRDELFLLAIEMDLPDLLNFCRISKRINDLVCKRNDIWLYKLNKEFPQYKSLEYRSFKKLYQELYDINIYVKTGSNNFNLYEIYNLKYPKLIEGEDKKLTAIAQELIIITEFFAERRKKAYYLYLLYGWLSKNVWYLEKNENFKDAIQSKLKDFRHESDTQFIVRDFGWMEKI